MRQALTLSHAAYPEPSGLPPVLREGKPEYGLEASLPAWELQDEAHVEALSPPNTS